MSTLRIHNIEAKSVPASPTIDEKVKITNSSGDVLIHIDGKTSGITTIGINTTAGNIKFDANSNVVVTGIITATKFVGTIEPTDLTVSGKVSVGGSVTAATFYGSGANLTGIDLGAVTGATGDFSIADKIVHTGDTNTALRFPAADTFTVETGGSERLRIDSNGFLGIDNASPVSSFVSARNLVIGTASGNHGMTIMSGTSNSGHIEFSDGTGSDATKTAGGIRYYHDTDYMRFNTGGGTERLRITSEGNIGINVTPANYSNYVTLALNDTTGSTIEGRVGGTLTGSFSVDSLVTINAVTSIPMIFKTANIERLRINPSGNTRIGGAADTTDQGYRLTLQGSANATYLQFFDNGTGTTHGSDGSFLALIDQDFYVWNREAKDVVFGSSNNERLRIKADGKMGLGTNNPTRMLHVKSAGANATQIALIDNDSTNEVFRVGQQSDGDGFLQVLTDGATVGVQLDASGTSYINSGNMGIGYNAPRRTLEVNSSHDSTADTITPVLRLSTGTGYSGSNTGSGLEFGTTSTSYPTWIKGRIGAVYNGSSNYGGHLVFETNSGSAAESSNSEKMRISDKGLITNTTQSTHPQGAGTFEIKGVINQYSQGSGSGLIFDCDFGRLTGYGDDTNVSNGTNLSACLSHSTTDWTSSNSNTPITVNGGTFQYRVGFGGYMEGINNGGRVSVAAGSGNPAMSDKLNTAAMTIECWCWYDGTGREVLVSRYGSGFPNQFNMLTDPNGQFHYNNGGVGAGSGDVSGEHFPDKTWHHHLWQYESGVNRWYINGAFANSRSAGSSLAVNDQSGFAIFSRADRYEDFRGKIAVVRIYNRALSAAEIKNHFELERGRFGI